MKALVKLEKVFFISLQKLFSFSRKSNFRILNFQISWRHQMPKHKTRNTFHWITWEVNTVCYWNLASLCHITKKILSKFFTKTAAPFCVCKEWSITSIGKWNFWRKLLILDLQQQIYQNLSKSACWPPLNLFYRGFFEN